MAAGSNRLTLSTVATILIVAVSLYLCLSMTPDTLLGWGTMIPVAMVPVQIVITLFWGCGYPENIGRLTQPLKGIVYLALTLLAGGTIAGLAWMAVGGAIAPPTPYVNMYLIFTVCVILWVLVVFQGWPLNLVLKHPGALGVGILLGAHAIAYLLFRLLFNFSFLHGSPIYFPNLDPSGIFVAWIPLVAIIVSLVPMLSLVLFDFWPVAAIAEKIPLFRRQPFFGIASAAIIGLVTALLWMVFVVQRQMDLVAFMVRVGVSGIFGVFTLLVMYEAVPDLKIPQPWRGLVLTVIGIVIAVFAFPLYRHAVLDHYPLPAGQPTYALELWISSAMLSITLPTMVVFAGFLKFWPLSRIFEKHL